MNGKERMQAIINHEPTDRVGIFESFWWETAQEWYLQGLPDKSHPEDYFNLDAGMFWFDQSFLLPKTIIEETEEFKVVIDEWGTHQKEFKLTQSTPGHIAFGITNRQQWEEEYKHRLNFDSSRINWDEMDKRYSHLRKKGRYKILSVLDPFECTWHIVGAEQQLLMLSTDPDWVLDMFETNTKLLESAIQAIFEQGYVPDALWIFGDVAYRNGMLMSPSMYKELLLPFHKRYVQAAHDLGCQVIYHSDGDFQSIIPMLIEAGIDCIHPMEVKAGMDVRDLKQQYGKQLAFMGNIDARLFQENDRKGLENEIRSKLSVAMDGGGYIFHSDHSIPPGTELDTYQYVLTLVNEIGKYI